MGENKHINKIPPKVPGQSREINVYVFFSLCVFFSLPKFKRDVLGTTRGAPLGEEHVKWLSGCAEVPYQGPFPVHKAPRMPKDSSKKPYLAPDPKACLRQGTFEKPRYYSVVNLLRRVIHYSRYSKAVHKM